VPLAVAEGESGAGAARPRRQGGDIMKQNMALVIALGFGAIGIALPAFAHPATNDKAEIQALEDRFGAAFNAKDLDAIMKVYAPGESLFVFDVVPPRDYVGWEAYRKDWQTFLATFKGPLKFTLSDLDIHTDGTLGYSHSIQHVTGTDTKDKPVDFAVRVTDVYKKIKGDWLIVQEHVSVPVDFDTGKPDMMSKP
jgi:ketosteroid isomerase-like protein